MAVPQEINPWAEALPEESPLLGAVFHSPKEAERFFAEVFWAATVSDDDTAIYRIAVAWRLVREWATKKGFLGHREELENAMGLNDPATGKPMWESILPQHLPQERLPSHLRMLEQIAGHLNIEGMGNIGILGARKLFDPLHAPRFFPSAIQLVLWEKRLVARAARLMVQNTTSAAVDKLAEEGKLGFEEALALCSIARERLKRLYPIDDEEANRVLAVARIENLAHRARRSLNLKTELAAMKLHAQILGLTGQKPPSEDLEFIKVVSDVERRQEALPHHDNNDDHQPSFRAVH